MNMDFVRTTLSAVTVMLFSDTVIKNLTINRWRNKWKITFIRGTVRKFLTVLVVLFVFKEES